MLSIRKVNLWTDSINGEITSSEGTTLGDPLAMAIYALAVKPLIAKIQSDVPSMRQVWYANDATGARSCEDLISFWESMPKHGAALATTLTLGSFALSLRQSAKIRRGSECFAGLKINITTERKCHLAAAIGTRPFIENMMPTR